MKKPFELDSAFLSIQEESSGLKKRLEKLETWEPRSVEMQVWLSSNVGLIGGAGAIAIPFDTPLYDTRSTFSLGTYMFTAPVSGIYHAVCQGAHSGGAGNLTIVIAHSDGVQSSTMIVPLATLTRFNFSHYFQMETDETLAVYAASTGNTNLLGGGSSITTLSVSLSN